MDIAAEKEDLIRKFNQVHDIGLIKAIKSLLEFGLEKQDDEDADLKASIDRAIKDSENGRVRSYEDFMADMRKRYRA